MRWLTRMQIKPRTTFDWKCVDMCGSVGWQTRQRTTSDWKYVDMYGLLEIRSSREQLFIWNMWDVWISEVVEEAENSFWLEICGNVLISEAVDHAQTSFWLEICGHVIHYRTSARPGGGTVMYLVGGRIEARSKRQRCLVRFPLVRMIRGAQHQHISSRRGVG